MLSRCSELLIFGVVLNIGVQMVRLPAGGMHDRGWEGRFGVVGLPMRAAG